MNKEQYSRYDSSTKTAKAKDVKFYRKRIYDLTKQLIQDEEPDSLFPDIKKSFHLYVNNCIDYFKILDKTDIIQEDYQLFDVVNNMNTADEINTNVTEKNMDDQALSMMRSIKIREPTSLEKIVKRTSTKPPAVIILPQKKEINLKNPELKNKGIRKKKNINNNYEEKNKQENKEK